VRDLGFYTEMYIQGEGGGSMVLRNVGILLQQWTVSQPGSYGLVYRFSIFLCFVLHATQLETMFHNLCHGDGSNRLQVREIRCSPFNDETFILQYVLIAWCLAKHRDNFTFTIYLNFVIWTSIKPVSVYLHIYFIYKIRNKRNAVCFQFWYLGSWSWQKMEKRAYVERCWL